MAQFDIKGARAEGYDDAEIADYLAAQEGFDIKGARAEGYDDAEIIDLLSGAASQAPKNPIAQLQEMLDSGKTKPQIVAKAKELNLAIDEKLLDANLAYRARGGRAQLEPTVRPESTIEQIANAAGQYAGVATNALAPYATAAGLGAAAGSPAGGVGAIPGAALGVTALGLGDLGTGLVYNPVMNALGYKSAPLPSELIRQGYRSVGVGTEPQTASQRLFSAGVEGMAGATSGAAGANTLARMVTNPTARNVFTTLAAAPAVQAVAGTTAGVSGQAATEAGAPPLVQLLAALGGGMVGGKYAAKDAITAGTMADIFADLAKTKGEAKAAEILRKSLGSDLENVRIALMQAPPDVRRTTAQFLASKGILPPNFLAVSENVAAGKGAGAMTNVAAQRAEDLAANRLALRGGGTATEAEAARAAEKQRLLDLTLPIKRQALGRADVGRKVILPAEQVAANADMTAAEKSAQAKRFLGFAEPKITQVTRADDLGELGIDNMADVIRLRGEAGLPLYYGEKAAEDSLIAGEVRNENMALAAKLRAQGMQPLNLERVYADLAAKAAYFENTMPDRGAIFSKLAGNVKGLIGQFPGGVVPAEMAHDFRMNLNNTVRNLIETSGGTPSKAYTAKLTSDVSPLIDQAIKTAGGAKWGTFLDKFSKGMTRIEQRALGDKLGQLSKENEEEFLKVMAGERPEFVAEYAPKGIGDISNPEVLGDLYPRARALADDIAAGLNVKSLGTRGFEPSDISGAQQRARTEAYDLLKQSQSPLRRFGLSMLGTKIPGAYHVGSAANEAYSSYLSKGVQNALAAGMANPSEAYRLMGVQPNTMATRVGMLPQPAYNALLQGLTPSNLGAGY